MNEIETKTLHERAMEASSVGIVIADMREPNQPLIYVNPAFEQITGYAAAEVLGRSCPLFLDSTGEAAELESIHAALQSGVDGHALLRSHRKDGSPFWNELVVTPVRDAEGLLTHFIGILKDVSKRRLAEEALQRYEFIANAVGEMMSVISRDHRYEAVNDKWCESLGQKREAVIGASVVRVWGEAVYSKSIAPMVERCFKEGAPIPIRARVHFPALGDRDCDITYYPYHVPTGEVTHVVAVTRDITDQIRTEHALQASESQLRTILDSVLDGIIVIDEQGVIESFNPAAERLFGYRSQDIVGHNVSQLMPEPHRSGHDGYLQRYLTTHQAKIIGIGQEVVGRRSSGETFPMDLAVSETRIGRHRKFVGIARDISERKHAELELIHTLELAQAASRAKSEFLSSMSHELRTPLNAILGFAQLLEMDPAMGKNQSDDLKEILKAGQHLLELINEVLDLSRVESGTMTLNPAPVALADILGECVTLVESDAGKRDITVQWLAEPCQGERVLADPLRLKQVLLNLLSNAIKYNRHGGNVRLECGAGTDQRLRVSVVDTGIGIPVERQAELFTAFQRLGQERSGIEGTGIGLVISRRLIELMGGAIGVDSRPGEGSRFWFELPRADGSTRRSPPGEAPSASRQTAAGVRPGGFTLLYIEDNPANLKLMQHVLAHYPDIRLISCEEPEDGLERARLERPDLILLDINLPGMDGYAVLALLREWEETRTTPVIGVSAYAMPTDIARAQAAGFDDYLTKPLDIGRLMQAIDQALSTRSSRSGISSGRG